MNDPDKILMDAIRNYVANCRCISCDEPGEGNLSKIKLSIKFECGDCGTPNYHGIKKTMAIRKK